MFSYLTSWFSSEGNFNDEEDLTSELNIEVPDVKDPEEVSKMLQLFIKVRYE